MALQIENVEAVADVDYIAAVEGVDVLFVGPADLSQSLGIPGQWDHPDLWRAIERTAEACRRVGKHWAVLPVNLDFARRCVALDCRMLSLGFDVWALHHGIHSYRQTFEDFFRDL
jgi:2-dehydro-3-deoxyglucarate aldolase/4-hydroxy-2-oxoheptanedioate aldolase